MSTSTIRPHTTADPARHTPQALAVCAALVFPTLLTWVYFVLLAGHAWMQGAYLVGKTLQFVFPMAWVCWVERPTALAWRGGPRGVGLGAAFGLVVSVLGWLVFQGYLVDSPALASLPDALRGKLSAAGITTPGRFLALALFYCLLHSGLEEYYWRWFVFGRLRAWLPLWPAVVISSLGFMAHHVLLVGSYVQGVPLVIAGSLAVAVGGAFWAWLYQRTGSLWGGWISHLLIDGLIMAMGYWVLWGPR